MGGSIIHWQQIVTVSHQITGFNCRGSPCFPPDIIRCRAAARVLDRYHRRFLLPADIEPTLSFPLPHSSLFSPNPRSLPVLNSRFLCASVLLILLAGCSEKSDSQKKVIQVGDSEAAAIKALINAGAVVKLDAGGSATDLDLHQQSITADTLKLISELKSLRAINLADSTFNDDQISGLHVASPRLVNLDLRGCKISDKGAAEIARFTDLRALRFSGKNGETTVGNNGLKELAVCQSLKVLALDDLWIETPGLESISDLKDLEELYLAGTVVDDSSAKVLSGFPKLKKLRLARTQTGDAGLEILSTCTTLEEIDLSENSLITNSGMAHLAKLNNLRKLNLWRVQISDDGALMLAPLSRLEWLNLDNTKLSDTGLSALKNMNALTFLHLGSTQVTAAGAPALFHLRSLKDLKVTRTALGADDSAIAKLKLNLPNTEIQTEYVENE